MPPSGAASGLAANSLVSNRGKPANLPIVGKVRPFTARFAPTDNPGPRAAVVGERVLVFPGAGFVQVEFGQVSLPGGGYLELTSLLDGDSEILHGGQSAYFNGNAVRVRLWAGPVSRGTAARIVSVATGEGSALGPLSLCSRIDNRRPLNDRRVARLLLRTNATVLVCTGFLFSSTNCFVTAGSCLLTRNLRSVTAQFNVPASSSNGTINNPPASSQYAWAGATSSRSANTGVDNNWGVFLTRTNSTGRHAGQNQGSFFRFTATTQRVNTLTKVVGYGTSLIKTRNATQQFHIGTLKLFSGNRLCFRTDTMPGNEGSPVVNANNDLVFGVTTAGGCSTFGGCNNGTASRNTAFAAARAALCKSTTPGTYTFFGVGCGPVGGGGCHTKNMTCTSLSSSAFNGNTFAMSCRETTTRVITGMTVRTRRLAGTGVGTIELWLTDTRGKPLTRVRAGTVAVGTTYQNYSGRFTSPFTMAAGRNYAVAFSLNGIVFPICRTGTLQNYWWHSPRSTTWNGIFTQRWSFRVDCGGSGSKVPLLTNVGTPSVGKTMRLNVSNARPSSPIWFCFGASRTRWGSLPLPFSLSSFGAPGCFINASCQVALRGGTSTVGTSFAILLIPNNRSLIGQTFFNQALIRDPGANALGISFTRGGAGKIGG